MSDIFNGISDELAYLWRLRDDARTPEELKNAQSKIDDYFLPSKKKAERKKPKKKEYIPDDGWCY